MNIKLKPKKDVEKRYFSDIQIGTEFTYCESVWTKVSVNNGSSSDIFALNKSNLTLKKFSLHEIFSIESDYQYPFSDLRAGVLFSYKDNAFVKMEDEKYRSLTGKTVSVFPSSVVTILVPDTEEDNER